MTDRFRIYGHRGSPKRFPENTVASFEEALRAGADGFETDLRLLSCGTPVLYHDDDLGDEETESWTWDRARKNTGLACVDDLASFAGRTSMILEVKRRGWEKAILDRVRDWPNIVVASFDHRIVAALRDEGAPFPLGITVHGAIVDVVEYAQRVGATWYFPKYPYVDRESVDQLHERGISVVPWTPNRVSLWERLRQIGCDGVITDYVAEAVQWRDATG